MMVIENMSRLIYQYVAFSKTSEETQLYKTPRIKTFHEHKKLLKTGSSVLSKYLRYTHNR